jgi:hypothetical protein
MPPASERIGTRTTRRAEAEEEEEEEEDGGVDTTKARHIAVLA